MIAAGKGTKYLPEYHASTPATVWGYYGLTAEQARVGGMNPQMFNSFLDGTKSAIEMAAVANATGLTPPPDGLAFPALRHARTGARCCGQATQRRAASCRAGGGDLLACTATGATWRTTCAGASTSCSRRRTTTPRAASRSTAWSTDASGRVSALYRPFHLIGLELNVSILSAALRGEATGAPTGFRGDVVATAKRDLKAGETLDGEGGACVWGKLLPAATSLEIGGLPIGLANRVPLLRDVPAGQCVTWDDVRVDATDAAYRYRREMEATISVRLSRAAGEACATVSGAVRPLLSRAPGTSR